MVPSTVTGVLVFLASVGPGYVYVRVSEQWRPYTERTPLREAAEIVVSGALASTVGVVVALVLAQWWGFLDLRGLALDPSRYLVLHPGRAGVGLLIVLVVSYGLAGTIAFSRQARERASDRIPPGMARSSMTGHRTMALSSLPNYATAALSLVQYAALRPNNDQSMIAS